MGPFLIRRIPDSSRAFSSADPFSRFQREIVLFVKGNAPALAAGQTALCGEALKIIKAGGAQIPLHRDLRGGILRCRPVVKGLDMKFGAI